MKMRLAAVLALCAVSAFAVGCGGGSTDTGTASQREAGSEADSGAPAVSVKLQGSGASFPDPLYQSWFKSYSKATQGVTVDYTAKGSGAGIKDLTSKLVDFAGSDAAMSDEEIAKIDVGVQMLPVTAGSVVLSYNLSDGPKQLKLSRDAYIKIFLGEITKWNDPAIVACNDGAAMPDKNITVVVRADSSGTTFVFSQHLSAISKAWAGGPGTGKSINWPGKNVIQATKNNGVTQQIKQSDGSIGYIEYGFAEKTGLAMASLENKSGKYIEPTLETASAALGNVTEMPENLRVWLSDPEGDGSYPIVTYTWLLCYKKYDDPNKAEAIRNLVKYCLTEGQKISGKMGYVPLPANVVESVTAATANIQ